MFHVTCTKNAVCFAFVLFRHSMKAIDAYITLTGLRGVLSRHRYAGKNLGQHTRICKNMSIIKLIVFLHCTKIFLKSLEREPLSYCKGDGNVIFTRPFLMLGKVTLLNMKMYW